jgi:hypothetical protein
VESIAYKVFAESLSKYQAADKTSLLDRDRVAKLEQITNKPIDKIIQEEATEETASNHNLHLSNDPDPLAEFNIIKDACEV